MQPELYGINKQMRNNTPLEMNTSISCWLLQVGYILDY